MPPRASDRLKALQERAAALAAPTAQPEQDAIEPGQALAEAGAHFGAIADFGQRAVQRIPVDLIAPDLRPGRQQARLLPLPEELEINGTPAPGYADMVAELRELGQSLKERQIQPIVVYPGLITAYPSARHIILVGHRRWTAACLTGLPTLDAIVVDEPELADRILYQYAENEAREEFSDMERAWSLLQMKQALGDVPWEAVESRMQISRARRQQLLRLTAFQSEQQQIIARLRLQETQIRTLHSALRANEISPVQVDSVLRRLDTIAAERRSSVAPADADDTLTNVLTRRVGIDGPTVARLVARARKADAENSRPASPRWLFTLRQHVADTGIGLARARTRLGGLTTDDLNALRSDVDQLIMELEAFVAEMPISDQGV